MLGLAPLAAIPLAGVLFNPATQVEMAGTTSITFTNSGVLGRFLIGSGTATLTFSPSAALYVNAYSGGDTSLTFANSGQLQLAGDPIVFNMVPANLEFRGNWRPAEFDMKPVQLTFRGVKQ